MIITTYICTVRFCWEKSNWSKYLVKESSKEKKQMQAKWQHMRTPPHMLACMHTRMHTRTHARTHARTHTRTHTHMHACMHTHTHLERGYLKKSIWILLLIININNTYSCNLKILVHQRPVLDPPGIKKGTVVASIVHQPYLMQGPFSERVPPQCIPCACLQCQQCHTSCYQVDKHQLFLIIAQELCESPGGCPGLPIPVGRFSEAGLLKWMPFIIFCARSRERSQCHFRPNFWVGVASCCV